MREGANYRFESIRVELNRVESMDLDGFRRQSTQITHCVLCATFVFFVFKKVNAGVGFPWPGG